MAKASGVLKIEGTVDDLTFYKQNGKNFVRRKGGVSKERILNDPNFVRTRENGAEFGHSANSGKLLRGAVGSFVFKAKDSKLSSRLMQKMSVVKNFDTVSARGSRNVATGIGTPQGKLVLKGFDFNINAELNSVLFAPVVVTTATGVIKINNLIPAEQMQFPQGATHFSLQGAFLKLDFATGVSDIKFSNVVNLPINFISATSTLTPTAVPVGTGVSFYLLLISFYQLINGVQYGLKNEEYNVLNVLEVV